MGVLAGLGPLAAKALDPDGGSSPLVRLTPFVQPLPLPPPPRQVSPFRPSAAALQQLAELGPAAARASFYEIVQEEVELRLHPDLPPTRVWRYRDVNTPESSPFLCGPTFLVPMGTPQVVRQLNRLPVNHVGFGVNHTTTHYHGGHVKPIFDGFPENIDDVPERVVIGPGEQFDYVYPMQDEGFTTGQGLVEERPSTQWYHDHLIDFTGPNVHRGLAAFYLVFDELDTGDETRGLRLPSGPYDVPLVLQDRRFAPNGQMVYTPGDLDGFLGDQFMVNGAVQPFLEVDRRKYRFRFLNGSNARYYLLRFTDGGGRVSRRFDMIGTDGGLLSRPLRDLSQFKFAPAERYEVVVDFSGLAPGTEVYLTNFAVQDSGRGPDGDFEQLDAADRDEAVRIMKFIVRGGVVEDRSRVPDRLRPLTPVPQSEIDEAVHVELEFQRKGGAWAINGDFVDLERPLVRSRRDRPEIWHIENGGGGWWHPVHVHIGFGRILSRNGRRPPLFERDGITKRDMYDLSGGDRIEAFFRFRDFTGSSVFHCHNLEHEDHFMMGRFDIEP